MGIEQAILDHAAAIRELAAAIRGSTSSLVSAPGTPPASTGPELEKAATQAETRAKPNTSKEAVSNVLAEAKKTKDAEVTAAPVVDEDDPLADSTPLDYEKDVKPLLIKVGKNKTELVALLDKFGAKKGDQIAVSDYAKVMAAANAILGG